MKDPTTEGYEVSADEIDGMVRNLCAYALGEPHPLHRYLDLTHQQVLFDGMAEALRKESDTSLALSVGVQLDEGPDRPDLGANISVGIADAQGSVARQARLVGGRDWVRVGAAELGLDCLRRHLLGLPVDERIDFERR